MLKEENFSAEYIEIIKSNKKIDKTILERTIYAFGLLESLVKVGMPFVFKGGTSLMLLLDHPKRLSTDIDIIVEPGIDVDHYIEEAGKIFPFKSVNENIRHGRNSIEKRHYRFIYDSHAFDREFYILLDILFESNSYSKIINLPIKNNLILTTEPYYYVTLPTVESILGDKLTAFAPHTTGIPYGIDKELEIIKQMYDIACLFDKATNFDDIYLSYMNTVQHEISYRGNTASPEDVLNDTIETAVCIISRGSIGVDYPLLLSGIRAIQNHIFDERFSAEVAIGMAAKVMYLASCILKNQKMEKVVDITKYVDMDISYSKFRKLSKIRKFDPYAFAYICKAIELLKE